MAASSAFDLAVGCLVRLSGNVNPHTIEGSEAMPRADSKHSRYRASRTSRQGARKRRYRKLRRALELLEDRRLLAQVSGLVWHDLDASGLRDEWR